MREMWRRIFGTATLAFMLCLTGLVMSGEALAERFVDNGNRTVTDTVTGLMWTKDANLFGALSWQDAMSRCSSFRISGISGWRMPNKDELKDFYHAIQGGHPFTGVQSWYYWSSTTVVDRSASAWNVQMFTGFVDFYPKTNAGHLWPVRAGQ